MEAMQSLSFRPSPLDPLRKNIPQFTNVRSLGAKRVPFIITASASTVSAPKREKDPKKRVVITGTGLVSVFGNDVDTYYDRLLAGESGISLIDRFDASKFPTRFGGQIRGFTSEGYIDGKNDRRLDDCLRYAIVAGKKALENADLGGDRLEKIDKERAGVLVGTGMGGLTVFSDGVQNLIEKGHRKITPFFIPYAITNMGSALLGIDLGFMGPNYSISTACATSNYCFYAAANHIRRGEADLMLAGGTEAAIIPIGLGGFVACRALSQRNDDPQTASRPWDKERDGFVMGEGAGILVMESLEHAMKRGAPIIAEYLGGAVNCDAYHMTDPRADGLGVSSCILSSLEDAGVSPEEVNYINAHATSTIVGDLAEINAVKKVFKTTSGIKMNATKSMIGHCLGAAGGLEAIATIKAITTGWVHPSINQFLSWNVIIPVENLDVEGLMLQKAIVSSLMDDFAAKKASKNLGYFMALTTLERIGEGKVREHTGDVLFPVEFSCVTFKIFRGEILEGVVDKILKHGVFLRCGPTDKVYLSHQKMADYKYVPGENPIFMNNKMS
ncbi:hypothetical protein RDI58_004922 [Solanum bulbocastanum]|uniref:3-oxoacyl-[acyl-carrier-protein] synthase I, chloroplastic n=1 Tax=Solanum bulbocastanum TaxID=147425 RepID=A0AAN8TZI6_SOLBU